MICLWRCRKECGGTGRITPQQDGRSKSPTTQNRTWEEDLCTHYDLLVNIYGKS